MSMESLNIISCYFVNQDGFEQKSKNSHKFYGGTIKFFFSRPYLTRKTKRTIIDENIIDFVKSPQCKDI